MSKKTKTIKTIVIIITIAVTIFAMHYVKVQTERIKEEVIYRRRKARYVSPVIHPTLVPRADLTLAHIDRRSCALRPVWSPTRRARSRTTSRTRCSAARPRLSSSTASDWRCPRRSTRRRTDTRTRRHQGPRRQLLVLGSRTCTAVRAPRPEGERRARSTLNSYFRVWAVGDGGSRYGGGEAGRGLSGRCRGWS